MSIGQWFRKVFSPNRAEDDAAEAEEYGRSDRPDLGDERGRLATFGGTEAAEVADYESDELKAPPDPAP